MKTHDKSSSFCTFSPDIRLEILSIVDLESLPSYDNRKRFNDIIAGCGIESLRSQQINKRHCLFFNEIINNTRESSDEESS